MEIIGTLATPLNNHFKTLCEAYIVYLPTIPNLCRCLLTFSLFPSIVRSLRYIMVLPHWKKQKTQMYELNKIEISYTVTNL